MKYPGRVHWLKIGSWVFAAVLSLTVAGMAHAAPAAQPAGGTVTGQVISLDNVPLANIKLAAYNQPGTVQDRQPLANAVTDAQGNYTMTVPAGQIWVSFLTQDIAGQSFWGYDNLPVNITPGERLLGVDFRPAIRVVATPVPAPTATALPPAPAPTEVPPVGMPASGSGPSPVGLLTSLLGLMLVTSGLTLLWFRRRATR